MNHLDPLHHIHKHSDASGTHHAKAGSWLHHARLAHHGSGFYQSHAAGTFHSLGSSAISLPSDHVVTIELLP